MTILKKKNLIRALLVLFISSMQFQPHAMALLSEEDARRQLPETPHVFDYLKQSNTWLSASNPAGMAFTEMYDLGNSYFSHFYNNGNFHRPQEPGKINQFGFTTERFQSLNELKFVGQFTFLTTSEHDRKWGAMMDPYIGNPYVFADESGGNWSKQFYNLSAGMSSGKLFDLFHAGFDADYVVQTGARQADPRPLNNNYFVTIRPGVVFPVGENTSLGLSGYYRNRNEDIDISVSSQDFQHRWFKMRGVGEYRSGFMRTFLRAYSGNTFGGGLQFEYKNQNLQLLAEVNYHMLNEEALDGTDVLQHGGEYDETILSGFVSLKYERQQCLHLLKSNFNVVQGRGTEHSQNYDMNEERWVTFATTLRYTGDRYSGGVHYNYFRTNGKEADYNWMAGLHTDVQLADLRFLLPNSTQVNTFATIQLLGKKNISISQNTLHLGLSAGYKLSLDDELSIHQELFNSERTVLVDMVVTPDFEYLITDHLSFGLDFRYNFSLLNLTRNNFYVGIKADKFYLTESTADEGFIRNGRNFFQARIGMVY